MIENNATQADALEGTPYGFNMANFERAFEALNMTQAAEASRIMQILKDELPHLPAQWSVRGLERREEFDEYFQRLFRDFGFKSAQSIREIVRGVPFQN